MISRIFHILVLALLLNALLAFVLPLVEASFYMARLAVIPRPGSLPLPVLTVKEHALRDTWHAPRSGGRRHEGIDIFARRGTPVVATTEGIVTRRGNGGLGGKTVWVLGPGGQRHYYAHLDGFADVAPGQRIQAGTVLGYVGTTGNAKNTAPHLHYGIYNRTGAVNPYPLLRRRAAQGAA